MWNCWALSQWFHVRCGWSGWSASQQQQSFRPRFQSCWHCCQSPTQGQGWVSRSPLVGHVETETPCRDQVALSLKYVPTAVYASNRHLTGTVGAVVAVAGPGLTCARLRLHSLCAGVQPCSASWVVCQFVLQPAPHVGQCWSRCDRAGTERIGLALAGGDAASHIPWSANSKAKISGRQSVPSTRNPTCSSNNTQSHN